MIDRRHVLKLGATTVAGAIVSKQAAAIAANPIPIYRGVFDERFEDSLAFADQLAASGVRPSAIGADVAGLWYDDLRARLKQNPAPISGLTDRAALFCLEELARDVGMRVVVRVDHLIDQQGVTEHHALGSATLVETTRKLGPRAGFGRIMAVLVSQHDANGPRDINAQKRTGPAAPAGMTALVTWVIA